MRKIELSPEWDMVWPEGTNGERHIYYLRKGGRYGMWDDHLIGSPYHQAMDLAKLKGLVKSNTNGHILTPLGESMFNLTQ